MDEDLVSTSLRPFHTTKVEQSLKDRFRASFRERMAIIGDSLGLPEQAVDDIVILETHVRPIATRIAQLLAAGDPDEHRVEALVETLKAHLQSIDLQDSTLPRPIQGAAHTFCRTRRSKPRKQICEDSIWGGHEAFQASRQAPRYPGRYRKGGWRACSCVGIPRYSQLD